MKNLYEVLPAGDGGDKAGLPVGTRILVSHWVWVNGERAVAPPAEKGRDYHFMVEPVEAHSEIKSLVRKSTIENDFNFPEYLDIAPW